MPIPEEVPIITGGVLVGKAWDVPNSGMYWQIMLPVCIFGVVACDVVLYGIGRRWGSRLLHNGWVQRRLLPPEKKLRIERNFHEYGIAILMVARFMPGIRSPIFFMSGVMKVPFKKFMFADLLYAIPGVNILFWLSYWFTDQVMEAFHVVERKKEMVVALVLAAVAGALVYSFFKRKVATGDPRDIPVVGKQVASIIHHIHDDKTKGDGEPPAGAAVVAQPGGPTPPVPLAGRAEPGAAAGSS